MTYELGSIIPAPSDGPYHVACMVCNQPAEYSTGVLRASVHWCEEHLPDWARRAYEDQQRERAEAEKRATE